MPEKSAATHTPKVVTITRQSRSNRIVHALVASSTFGLIVTGLGQMPFYSRYKIADIPGLTWLGSYEITLWLHYLFAFVLMGAVTYHILYHALRREFAILPKRGDFKHSLQVIGAMVRGQKEPPSEKYLPEQRLAYAFIAFAIGLTIVTGLIKVYTNVPGWNVSDGMHFWSAQLHNLGFFLVFMGIIAHLAAFLFKPNRKLLGGMRHGQVEAHYTLERHAHWKEGVQKARSALAGQTPPESAAPKPPEEETPKGDRPCEESAAR